MNALDIAAADRLKQTHAVQAASVRRKSAVEIEQLLHKRLRFLTALFGGIYALQFAVDIVPMLIGQTPWPTGLALFGHISVILVFVTLCLVAGIVWSKPNISFRQLRAIELILFGMAFLRLAIANTVVLWSGPALGEVIQMLTEGRVGAGNQLGRLAIALIYPWVVNIILYGIMVPNTWRRCTLVVGVAALTPTVIWVIASVTHDLPASLWLRTLLTDNLRPLAVGSAIAIYGSYRIETLREEAAEARRLGPYQLKQCLGIGGMGEVYLAEHLLLKRPCAIKLISPEQAGDRLNLVRFEREVQATATLTHPNTVQVFDYGVTEEGVFYYAMEYLRGLTLNQLVLRCGPLSAARAIHLLRQVSAALQEAHHIGLVHRDIKPGNVLVCEHGGRHDVVKLLDFGLVRSIKLTNPTEQLTQEGTIAGTPEYMSPEQAAGEQKIDGRSDLYSLGAVAYYLLTGQPPFARNTAMRTLTAQIHEFADPPSRLRPNIPVDLEAVVIRCLKKDPKLRFPDATALELALAGCKDAELWKEDQAAEWWRVHRPIG